MNDHHTATRQAQLKQRPDYAADIIAAALLASAFILALFL